jgi:hypothetical protein
MDSQTGIIQDNVLVGTAPGGIASFAGKLYVCNSGNYMANYAGSSVSVIDLESFEVIRTIPLPANPQYLAIHNGLIHVSSTGNWSDITGVISVIDPARDEVIQTIPLGGSPRGSGLMIMMWLMWRMVLFIIYIVTMPATLRFAESTSEPLAFFAGIRSGRKRFFCCSAQSPMGRKRHCANT